MPSPETGKPGHSPVKSGRVRERRSIQVILVVFLVEIGLILDRKPVPKVAAQSFVPFAKSNLFDVIIVSLMLKRFLTVFGKESILVGECHGNRLKT